MNAWQQILHRMEGEMTAGDNSYPIFTSNVAQSRIDANTSVAWGPFFTLREKLPAGARISLRIAGGNKSWGDDSANGPTLLEQVAAEPPQALDARV